MTVAIGSNLGTAAPGSTGAAASAAPMSAAPSTALTLAQLLNKGISRNPASEALSVAYEKVSAVLKESANLVQGVKIAAMRIDNATHPDLLAPSIVLVALSEEKRVIAYTIAMLEAGAAPLEPETKTIAQGVTITVDRYVEEIYNRTYHDAVQATVTKAAEGYTIANNGNTAALIPATFDWNDAAGVRTAVLALLNVVVCDLLIETKEIEGVNLKTLSDARLSVRYSFGPKTERNVFGQPVRADLVIDTSINFRNGQRASSELNEGSGVIRLAKTLGFIDMAWVGAPAGQSGGWGNVQAPSRQRFAPRVVLTAADSQTILNNDLFLLSTLGAAMALREGTNWFPYFRASLAGLGNNRADPRDVGALNIEANIEGSNTGYGVIVDTKSNAWGDADLGRFLSTVCYPDTILSIDVPTLGIERATGGELLIAAAQGQPAAQQAVLNAANSLTGGHFASFYQGGEPVIVDDEVVLLGTYQNDAGQLADIRDIDYLAVMNLVGRTDPTVGGAWARATSDYSRSQQQRLSEQRRMINQVVGNGSVKFTGTARRVTLAADFVLAFAAALKAAGVQISVNNPGAGADFSGNRPMLPWLDRARVNNSQSGAFQVGGYGRDGQAFVAQQGFAGVGRRY